MAEEKIFIGKVTEKVFANGGTMLKLSLSPDDLKKVSKTGWLNINISKSQTKGTYYGTVDTWEPKAKTDQSQQQASDLPF